MCLQFFLYFLQNYSGNHSCQNYFVKTTECFFYSVHYNLLPKNYHTIKDTSPKNESSFFI